MLLRQRYILSRLRVRLLLLVTLAVVPALLLALDSGLAQERVALKQANEDALTLARLAASSNTRLLEETRSLLSGLARAPGIRDGDLATCNAILAGVVRANALFTDLALVQANGDAVCRGTSLDDWSNVSDRHYFQHVVATREFAAADYRVERATGRGVILAGYPVVDADGQLRGVLHAGIDLTWLSRVADEMRFPSAAKLVVFDRDGVIWLQYPLTGPAIGPVSGAASVRGELSQRPERSGEYVGIDDTRYLYAYTPLNGLEAEPTAWVSVSVPRDAILAEANWMLVRHLLGLGLVAILAVAAAWFGGHAFILRRLDALVRATTRLASGDLTTRTGLDHEAGEIGELARAFDEMAGALQVQSEERARAEEERTQLVREQAGRLEAERGRERVRSILESIPDGFVVVDRTWRLEYINAPAAALFGAEASELVGRSFWKACPAVFGRECEAEYRRAATQRRTVQFEVADGARGRWLEVHAAPAREGVLVYLRDVTDRARAQQELHDLAFHDRLTGLPNRALFLQRLAQMTRSPREQDSAAILFVDLDNFKIVNDTLGHTAGDRLLVEVASRLQRCVRRGDTVARFGGDEFTILVKETAEAALALADRLAEALRAPIILEGRELYITASVGVAPCSTGRDRAEDPETLLRNADIAMYRAKASGKARAAVFDTSMNTDLLARLELETDLRRALARGELQVYYQPIFALESKRVVEAEALLRWAHPKRGLVAPGEFIPVAEETGLIVPIGQWVLEQACQQAQAWRERFPHRRPIGVSVNLSARQFQQPDLLARVQEALRKTRLDPRLLKLEITESVVMQDADAAVAPLQALKQLGVQLAIDDFGTGYSSLSYLKRFPVDTLKVDRSFVDGLGHEVQDTAIVRSIIALAKALRLSVTGEGIESPTQEAQLRALGCDLGQGYLLGRPMVAESLEALLRQELHAAGAAPRAA